MFAFLIKLTIIFFGGGLISLLAYWVLKEARTIPKLILDSEIGSMEEGKLYLAKREKISAKSGVYEVLFSGERKIKLFSSHKGIKLM